MIATTRPGPVRSLNAQASLRRLQTLAKVMDTAIRIPGTKIRFGADTVIGLVPGVGDVITTGISLYALAEATRHGVPPRLLLRMLGNIALDAGIGSVPIVGDIVDMFFMSNTRNLRLLMEHLEKPS